MEAIEKTLQKMLAKYQGRMEITKCADAGLVVVDMWADKYAPEYHVHIIFEHADAKKCGYDHAYVSGDLGCYTFGKNICNATAFFAGPINMGYWEEKLECGSALPDFVDTTKLTHYAKETLQSLATALDQVDPIDDSIAEALEDEPELCYRNLTSLYQKAGISEAWEAASADVKAARPYTCNFLYIVECLHLAADYASKEA